MPLPRTRPDRLPAVLSYGFRPFFLLGTLYAGVTLLVWLPLLRGAIETASLFAPVDWHSHEMLFGYLAAVLTGFLLTAIPNWTGRLPVQGYPLLGLVVLWTAGRVAVFYSVALGWLATAVIDCSFLLAVTAAAAIEIAAGRNWRNLKVVIPVGVFALANILFHLEAHLAGASDMARRLGIGTAIVLIVLIGGRIISSFTRNWLARENPGRLPIPVGRFDMATILMTAIGLLAWTFVPEALGTAVVLIAAAGLNLIRLARWAGDRTLRDPLVLILHLAYAFVPVGLAFVGCQILDPARIAPAVGVHALGAGAIGTMTLAVMVRATLGHTGRPLRAGGAGCFVFAAILASAVARIIAALGLAGPWLMEIAGGLWAVAFLGFALFYGVALLRPRLSRGG
ncbi:MAG: NnrS family protein [Candidatus Kaistia colombiensis]|nr:MAG: NnrS family protein [Kaistia sp.]